MSDVPSYPTSPSSGPPLNTSDAKGFFAALFDFKFQTLITPKVVKVVYAFATVVLIAAWAIWTVAAFSDSAGLGLLSLVVGPIFVILYLVFIRMTLELYFAVVRMSDDIHRAYNK